LLLWWLFVLYSGNKNRTTAYDEYYPSYQPESNGPYQAGGFPKYENALPFLAPGLAKKSAQEFPSLSV
jgi:hypothetical protein